MGGTWYSRPSSSIEINPSFRGTPGERATAAILYFLRAPNEMGVTRIANRSRHSRWREKLRGSQNAFRSGYATGETDVTTKENAPRPTCKRPNHYRVLYSFWRSQAEFPKHAGCFDEAENHSLDLPGVFRACDEVGHAFLAPGELPGPTGSTQSHRWHWRLSKSRPTGCPWHPQSSDACCLPCPDPSG